MTGFVSEESQRLRLWPRLARAEMAAREMGELSLPDALEFCLLLAEFDPERWPRAIARWTARFVLEARGMGVDEAALAFSSSRALPGPHGEIAAESLRRLATAHGLSSVAAVLRDVRRG